MKKITLLVFVLGLSIAMTAQTSLNFESDAIGTTTNATALWDGGSVDVVANPVTTGINTSTKALHVLDNNYCDVFYNIALPAGTKTAYPYASVKYKLYYIGPNGGTDLNYPLSDFFSVPSNAVGFSDANTTPSVMKFANPGWDGGVSWGTPTVGTWLQCEFSFVNSTLTDIPAGYLVFGVAKPKLEYLIDDIQLIPSPLFSPNILTLDNFEDMTIDDALTTTGGGATASVKADPANAAEKSALVVLTNYGSYLRLNVTLPAGKVLSDYDMLYYDRYVVATVAKYTPTVIMANSTTIYADPADTYPSLGTNNVWQTKTVDLTKVDLSAVGNSFNLDLSLNTTDLSYYLDNIKLHLKDVSTAINTAKENSINAYVIENKIKISQLANQVDVFDLGGRLLVSKKNVTEVNVSNLNKGIYMVKVNVNGQTQVVKVVR